MTCKPCCCVFHTYDGVGNTGGAVCVRVCILCRAPWSCRLDSQTQSLPQQGPPSASLTCTNVRRTVLMEATAPAQRTLLGRPPTPRSHLSLAPLQQSLWAAAQRAHRTPHPTQHQPSPRLRHHTARPCQHQPSPPLQQLCTRLAMQQGLMIQSHQRPAWSAGKHTWASTCSTSH